MAISTVTSPRSSRDDGECATDETREQVLNRVALEDDGEKSGESRRGDGRDGVFGGRGSVVVIVNQE